MRKLFLYILFFMFSTSAFALFPMETDWAKNHLQGKVKSVKTKSEGNPALPDNDSVSYLDAFYNEQGFLTQEKEQGEFFDKENIVIRHYKYDSQNRLFEIQNENVTASNPEMKFFSAFYRYLETKEENGVMQFVEYVDKPDFTKPYQEKIYDKERRLLLSQEYDPQSKTASRIKKYEYKDGKLSKVCDVKESNSENECETYHYADDDSFIASSSGFGGYLVKNTFDKNHRLLKGEIFHGNKLIEWVTMEYKFDPHGNVIEEVVYNKNGVWKTKITHQYKYYE